MQHLCSLADFRRELKPRDFRAMIYYDLKEDCCNRSALNNLVRHLAMLRHPGQLFLGGSRGLEGA